MPEEEIQNQTQNPSHLVVEQGLFSRAATTPEQSGTTAPVNPPHEEAVDQAMADYNGAGGLLSKLNLFWALLIPMVIIELILIFFVIKG